MSVDLKAIPKAVWGVAAVGGLGPVLAEAASSDGDSPGLSIISAATEVVLGFGVWLVISYVLWRLALALRVAHSDAPEPSATPPSGSGSAAASPPPGWYPKPDGSRRWWDGAQFTDDEPGASEASGSVDPAESAAKRVLRDERSRSAVDPPVDVGKLPVMLLGIAVVVVVALVGGFLIFRASQQDSPPNRAAGPGGQDELAGVAGPERFSIVSTYALGQPARGVVPSGSTLWVPGGQTLRGIDPADGTTESVVRVGDNPRAVVAGLDALWVGTFGSSTSDGGSVERVDPLTGSLVASIPVNGRVGAVAVGRDAVWVAALNGGVIRIDPSTNKIVATIPADNVTGIAVGPDAVWAIGKNGVLRIDPSTNKIVATIPTTFGGGVAVGRDAVWATANGGVVRIDPTTNRRTDTIPVQGSESSITVSVDAVWVTSNDLSNLDDGAVIRIDPTSATVTDTVSVPSLATGVAVTDGDVWVTTSPVGRSDGGALLRINSD